MVQDYDESTGAGPTTATARTDLFTDCSPRVDRNGRSPHISSLTMVGASGEVRESRSEGPTPVVVFVCVHNAGRSQMAAGWTRHLAGRRVEVASGGSAPSERINPGAVAAMAEVGIDIGSSVPQKFDDAMLGSADVVVTMGCGDTCPAVPGVRREDWPVTDPAGLSSEEIRPIRDEIRSRVERLLASLGIDIATDREPS